VIYGKDINPIALKVDAKRLREVLGPTGTGHHLLTVKVEGNGQQSLTAVVKEVQRNPLTGRFVNIDFQNVSLTERITANLPIVLTGAPAGAKDGGVLEHHLHEVAIECQAQHLPERIAVDISEMKIHDSLYVRDLPVPSDVTIMNEGDEMIATVTPPRLVEETPAEPTEEGAVEPEVIQRGKKDEEEEEEE
jgi:large subunit ribosomal protein L25